MTILLVVDFNGVFEIYCFDRSVVSLDLVLLRNVRVVLTVCSISSLVMYSDREKRIVLRDSLRFLPIALRTGESVSLSDEHADPPLQIMFFESKNDIKISELTLMKTIERLLNNLLEKSSGPFSIIRSPSDSLNKEYNFCCRNFIFSIEASCVNSTALANPNIHGVLIVPDRITCSWFPPFINGIILIPFLI